MVITYQLTHLYRQWSSSQPARLLVFIDDSFLQIFLVLLPPTYQFHLSDCGNLLRVQFQCFCASSTCWSCSWNRARPAQKYLTVSKLGICTPTVGMPDCEIFEETTEVSVGVSFLLVANLVRLQSTLASSSEKRSFLVPW